MTDNRTRKRGVSTPPYLCPDGSEPCGRYGYCAHCPHDKSKRMQAMTNKPEVFKFHCIGQPAPVYACNKPSDNSGEYVRLSDHERLQAEAERLQAERAADKARIAELEECMKYARTVMSVAVRSESISRVCYRSLTDEMARIDAALARHGGGK